MKIAALSPQFVVEAPASAEAGERMEAARKLRHLRVAQVGEVSETSPSDEVESETKSEASPDEETAADPTKQGLRRLSKLIREHESRQKSKQQAGGQTGGQKEQRKRRALAAYGHVASGDDPAKKSGNNFDDFY